MADVEEKPETAPRRRRRTRQEWLTEVGFIVLLALLGLLFLLMSGVGPGGTANETLMRLLLGVIVVVTLLTAARHRLTIVLGLLLGGSAFVFGILSQGVQARPGSRAEADYTLISSALWTPFFVLFVAILLKNVFSHRRVTTSTVCGAICAYVFVGVLWYFVYRLAEIMHPGSFSNLGEEPREIREGLFYFSFVTLTTLGYGDITPVDHGARALAILEAMVGQLFLVVLLARLVSVWGATEKERSPSQ